MLSNVMLRFMVQALQDPPLCRVGKNPDKKKTSPVGIFFVFFYIFAQNREFLGFFQFQEYF
jgi:hypothetical protein